MALSDARHADGQHRLQAELNRLFRLWFASLTQSNLIR